jgi:hypothetical protein
MRRVVLHNDGGPLGALCDPMSVGSIADAIRSITEAGPAERAALRARCLRAAAETWNWESEERKLLAMYAEILPETVHATVMGTPDESRPASGRAGGSIAP